MNKYIISANVLLRIVLLTLQITGEYYDNRNSTDDKNNNDLTETSNNHDTENNNSGNDAYSITAIIITQKI